MEDGEDGNDADVEADVNGDASICFGVEGKGTLLRLFDVGVLYEYSCAGPDIGTGTGTGITCV